MPCSFYKAYLLQRRFKGSVIFLTEKINKHNTEGYKTEIFFQDAKNETVHLKFLFYFIFLQWNFRGLFFIFLSSVQLYSFIFASWKNIYMSVSLCVVFVLTFLFGR